MNAKQITIKNITDNGYIIGKTIRGKGLEIFEADYTVYYTYYGVSKQKLSEKLDKYKDSKLYVNSYKCKNSVKSSSELKIPFEDFNIDLDLLDFLTIKKEGEFLGYISISKYKSDKDSQIQLCRDLLKLKQIETRDEIIYSYYDMDYDDNVKSFTSDSRNNYWDGHYLLEYGNNYTTTPDDSIYFDGRMNNYNDSEIVDYVFDEGGYLKEIDPDESICVYHRKYKDWYIGYSLYQTDMHLSYKDEDDFESEYISFITYKENRELLEKVKKFLKAEKEDLEIRCFISNELDEENSYRQTDIDFKVINLCYDNVSSLRNEIYEKIEWNYTNSSIEFLKAYRTAIDSKFKIREDLKIEVEKYSQFEDSTYHIYSHLALLKKLEKRYNYQMIQSFVSNSIQTIAWAIKQDEDEYHFNIAEVISDDINGEKSLKEFIVEALEALEKRRLEKITQKELYEKAARVFVSVDDSLESGNCKFGTMQFISKHGIDLNKIGAIRGDYLLSIENSNFTQRAVSNAIRRIV